MASFEKYRPQLKNGRIFPQGDRLVFEIDKPFDQIVLPIEMVDFLTQCNGELTVGDIIENIYHQKGSVQFKAIFKTLVHLQERGFLENGQDLVLPQRESTSKTVEFLSFKPLWNFYLGRRVINDAEHLFAFYSLSMLICIGAILSFQDFSKQWLTLEFLRVNASYLWGLGFLFVGSSILFSAKNILKCVLLLFLTGRAYNFGITFNGFACYFRVNSDSLFLITNRLFIFVFHIATTLCYFPLVSLFYFMFPAMPFQMEAYSLAVILALLEINPFQESEITQFFKSIFNDDTLNKISNYMPNRPLIAVVNPFDRSRQQSLFHVFSHYSTLWSVALFYLYYQAARFHFNSGLSATHDASAAERASALLSMSMMVLLLLVAIYNLTRLLRLSLIRPITEFVMGFVRQHRSRRVEFFSPKEIQNVLSELPLFSYFTSEILKTIISRSEVRQFSGRTPVILQGDDGTHLNVLLSGTLEVRQRQNSGSFRKLGEVHPPSIFGEIAVLDDTKRTAEVIATQESIVLMVPAQLLREISHDSQYIRELNAFKNAITVNQYFTSAPIFKELSEDVIHLFNARGKIENYKKDQVVFKQGDAGDGFYLLLRGSVGVLVNGRPVARIQQGGFFGEISMIADIPRTGTIYALEDSQVLKIGREAFWEILSRDINMAMFIESVGEMRIREDIEVLKIKPNKTA